MSKSLPTTKYFKTTQHAYYPELVNRDIVAATGVNFHVFGSYDNA